MITRRNATQPQYVDVNTSDLWSNIPEFADSVKTYEDLKAAIILFYPGADSARSWSLSDLAQLVEEMSRNGIPPLGDFGDYHRQFSNISGFLCTKKRLSEDDQMRRFAAGIQPALWDRLSLRLQISYPKQDPDDPYPISGIKKPQLTTCYTVPPLLRVI